MKVSSQTILAIVLLVNVFLAGMGVVEGIVQAHEDSARMTRMPADWRYRLPHDPEPVSPEIAPSTPGVVANLPQQSEDKK